MTYILFAIAMGAVAQISFKIVNFSKSRIGYGFGSPIASIMTNFGAGGFLLCIVPTAFIIGASYGFLAGLSFFGASFIGSFISHFISNLIGISGMRFIAFFGLPINIVLMIMTIMSI